MNIDYIQKIKDYINASSRNRIIFHRKKIPGINYIDIGLKLSEAIFQLKNSANLSLPAAEELEKILNEVENI
jgi:hypothetical protein